MLRRSGLVFDRMVTGATSIALAVSMILLLLVAGIGAADVVGTYALGTPLAGARELASEMQAVLIFMAMSYAQQNHEHVAVDFLTAKLPEAVRSRLLLLAEAVGFALFAVLTWRSGVGAMESFDDGEFAMGLLQFPIYPFKAAVALACLIATLQFARQITWRLLTGHPPGRDTGHAAQEAV